LFLVKQMLHLRLGALSDWDLDSLSGHICSGASFISKDLVGWVLGAIGFSLVAFFTPIALGHPDNWIHANPLTTPAHIVPEWYFLALYAILRSIPNKQSGVAAVALVIFTLELLGWGSMVSKNRCVTGSVQPLPIPRGVYAIADALHLFWIAIDNRVHAMRWHLHLAYSHLLHRVFLHNPHLFKPQILAGFPLRAKVLAPRPGGCTPGPRQCLYGLRWGDSLRCVPCGR
jgi:hypothetical protein